MNTIMFQVTMLYQHLVSISNAPRIVLYLYYSSEATNNLKKRFKSSLYREEPWGKEKLSPGFCQQGTASTESTYANSLSPELTTTKPQHTDSNQTLTLLLKRKQKQKHRHGIRKWALYGGPWDSVTVLATPPTSRMAISRPLFTERWKEDGCMVGRWAGRGIRKSLRPSTSKGIIC